MMNVSNYEKAFARVNHAIVIICLQQIDMKGKHLTFIINLYWTQNARIRMGKVLSK